MKDILERFLVTQFGAELPGWAKVVVSMTNVFLILLISWALMSGSGRVLRTLNARMTARNPDLEERKRIDTLIRVFRYIATVVIGAITIMLVLSEVGISIAPILATAGVAGLAVGFGAQSLVKDYFTGFVMILENQIRVGDSVEVGGKTGLVEEVTLRYVRLRDLEGAVHYVPNGVIATVTNRSREFAYAVIDVSVGYRERIEKIQAIITGVGADMQADLAFGSKLLEPVEFMGVEQWADSAVVLRCRFKVMPLEQGPVRREFLRRLKNTFDDQGIEIPFPSRTVYTRNE
ncbi:mechanosensitive ion channel family protein [beta proteobacterium MWH-UniP1]